jgi:hypothetical protein
MTITARSVLKSFLLGSSWLLLGIAALAFWFGGRAIHEFGKVDRLLAELLGLSIAVVTGALGFILKSTAENLDGAEDSAGQ